MYIPINNVDLQNGVETFESPFSFYTRSVKDLVKWKMEIHVKIKYNIFTNILKMVGLCVAFVNDHFVYLLYTSLCEIKLQ